MSASSIASEPDLQALAGAIERTQRYLLTHQSPQGYWVGELEADVSVSAGYIPLMYFMLGAVDAQRQRKAVAQVLRKQNLDGSWSTYHGGPGDLNVSIQAYFALKLAGIAGDDPALQRARAFILSKGGLGRANVITRVWLALFGQFDWHSIPSVPPEVILLPSWFPLNIYEFSSWSRATIMALAILRTLKPLCPVPETARIEELYVEPPTQRHYPVGAARRGLNWERVFLFLDSVLKQYERLPLLPLRHRALPRVVRWVVEHQEADGSWGGIMLPWVYSLMALKALGYSQNQPVIEKGLRGLESYICEDEETLRLQPSTSPVWDTAWTVLALRASGLAAAHPALRQAGRWLLAQEITIAGDWRIKNPRTEPGGWAFEFENDLYPDLDDSSVVARALLSLQLLPEEEEVKKGAIERARCWVLAMQCRDGGWAAFDRDNNRRILAHLPFADFLTPLDPTCADVTAHVVELLAELGRDGTALRRALAYLERRQERDGAWYGRWGVNYLYGTGLALAALGSTGAGGALSARRAASWLVAQQNADGGWGESCATYDDPALRGQGPSTASQTAWALLGLLAVHSMPSEAIHRGIAYLLHTQQADGTWQENACTGTGFPKVFYLRYDLYRIYFPLLALARYCTIRREGMR